MARASTVVAVAVAWLILGAPSAHAGEHVKPGPSGFNIAVVHAHDSAHQAIQADGVTAPDSGLHYTTTYFPCSKAGCAGFSCLPGQHAVVQTIVLPGGGSAGSPLPVCLGGKQMSIAASVASAFRRIPVPTPALHIQPVKGRTLVNFKTNYYATGGQTFTKTVHLLGQAVTLKIHVTSYDFQFGDGQHLTTTHQGAAYPNLTNHHEYPTKGTVHPTLITTWSADYKIDNGPWQPVDGTVTKQTPPQNLEVTTARPVLVNPLSPPR